MSIEHDPYIDDGADEARLRRFRCMFAPCGRDYAADLRFSILPGSPQHAPPHNRRHVNLRRRGYHSMCSAVMPAPPAQVLLVEETTTRRGSTTVTWVVGESVRTGSWMWKLVWWGQGTHRGGWHRASRGKTNDRFPSESTSLMVWICGHYCYLWALLLKSVSLGDAAGRPPEEEEVMR